MNKIKHYKKDYKERLQRKITKKDYKKDYRKKDCGKKIYVVQYTCNR